MVDFADGFRRAGPTVGNGWQFKAKDEGTATPWLLQNEVARPANSSITTLMYRASPVVAAGTFSFRCYFHWPNDGAYGATNAAEVFFRYDATGGVGNKRLAVVVTGSTGKLYERQWSLGALVQTERGSWTRSDTTDFVITITGSGDDFVIYDSNYVGPLNKVMEYTTDFNFTASGLGVGSGYLDRAEIDDIGMAVPTAFEISPITTQVFVDAATTWTDPSVVLPADSEMRRAGVNLRPYVAVDGVPQGVQVGAGVTLMHVTASVDGTGPLNIDPATITVASQARFVPSTHWTPASGVWTDYLSRGGQLVSDTAAFLGDPLHVGNYKYVSAYGSLQRHSMHFRGQGLFKTNQTGLRSIGLVAVLKQGNDGEYGLLQTAGSGTPVSVTYRHGRISLRAGGELLGFESHTTSSRAVIIVLSTAADGSVTMAVQGRSKWSAKASIAGFDDLTNQLYIGAAVSSEDQLTNSEGAFMELLDVTLWDHALSDADINQFMNRMNYGYGVAV